LFGLKKEASTDVSAGPGQFGDYYLRELNQQRWMAISGLPRIRMRTPFALRRLHDSLRSDSTSKKRFLQGCEVLSKIHDHDCVVGYYEHGKIDGALIY